MTDGSRSETAEPRRKLTMWAVAVLVVVVLVPVVVWRIVFVSPAVQVTSLGPPPAGELWVDLPGGARFELVGVLKATDTNPWWKADGSLHVMHRESFGHNRWPDDGTKETVRRVRMKLTGLSHNDLSPVARLDPSPKKSMGWSNSTTGIGGPDPASRGQSMINVSFVPGSETTSVRLGVLCDPFGPECRVQPDGTFDPLPQMPEKLAAFYRSVRLDVETYPAVEPGREQPASASEIRTWVTVGRRGSKSSQRPLNVRLTALDSGGRIVRPGATYGQSGFGFALPRGQIQAFVIRIQSADRTWITVDDIALDPGLSTSPTLSVTTDGQLPAPVELPKWTQRLDNGAIVSLLAISRPKDDPGLWWSPNGVPVLQPFGTGFNPGTQLDALPMVALVRVREESDGAPVLRFRMDRGISSSWRVDQLQIPDDLSGQPGTELYVISIAELTSHAEPVLTVGVGGGAWTSAGPLEIGSVKEIDGAAYLATARRSQRPTAESIRMFCTYRSETEARIVARDGGQTHVAFRPLKLMTRHGGLWEEFNSRMSCIVQSAEWLGDVPPEIELQIRPRNWAEFTGFKLAPAGRDPGPFELATTANPQWQAVPLIQLMSEAAGPVDGFADRFADQICEALRRKKFRFLKERIFR